MLTATDKANTATGDETLAALWEAVELYAKDIADDHAWATTYRHQILTV